MMKVLSACVIATVLVGLGASFGMAQDKPKEKRSAEERFKRLDKNADGKLSEEEFLRDAKDEKAEKAKNLFARLDANGDKSVSLDEFKAVARKKKDK